ncbi:hypothetical protein SLE2022_304300 [Rubroshorea leprosula]
MFRLLDSMRKTGVPGGSLARLTEEQGRSIEELRSKVRFGGGDSGGGNGEATGGHADGKIVELLRFGECMGLEVDGLEEVALKSVMRWVERTMKAADCVRLKTLKGILDVLSPQQSVDFLAGTCMLQIQLRQWRKRRESRRNGLLPE